MHRLVFAFVLFAAIPASAEQESIAVMPLATKTVDENIVSVLDNLMITAVSDIGQYRVISANDINAMLGLERMKEAVGCSDLTCAAEIGGALGAGFLLTGTVDVLGRELIFTATLLDVAKAEAVARKKLRIDNDENKYYDGVESLVAMVFGLKKPAGGSAAPAPFLGADADGASIKVTSDAPGTIILDGRDTGFTTPYVLSGIPAGTHSIEVVGPGKRGRAEVSAEKRGNHEVAIVWSEDVTGSARIDASVPGATVYFDGRKLGEVPQLVSDVATGAHTVEVSAMGYSTWEQTIDVPANATAEIVASLTERRVHSLAVRYFARMAEWRQTSNCDPENTSVDSNGWCKRVAIFNMGPLLDYRWAHTEYLALRVRLGLGPIDVPGDNSEIQSPLSALVGAAEIATIPLVRDDDPIATVSPHPFAINFGAGAEAVIGGATVFRMLGSAGFQLWWLYADFDVGVQFAPDAEWTDYADTAQISALDTFVFGVDVGFTFSF